MKDCSIQLTHHPGDLARVAQALARRGANIRALAVVNVSGHVIARIIPDDIEVARRAFEEANIRFEESEVHTVLLEKQPGRARCRHEPTRRCADQPRGALRHRDHGRPH